jgi:hypothetical protein
LKLKGEPKQKKIRISDSNKPQIISTDTPGYKDGDLSPEQETNKKGTQDSQLPPWSSPGTSDKIGQESISETSMTGDPMETDDTTQKPELAEPIYHVPTSLELRRYKPSDNETVESQSENLNGQNTSDTPQPNEGIDPTQEESHDKIDSQGTLESEVQGVGLTADQTKENVVNDDKTEKSQAEQTKDEETSKIANAPEETQTMPEKEEDKLKAVANSDDKGTWAYRTWRIFGVHPRKCLSNFV